MEHLELLQRLAVALGIGLLVGLERGWVERDEAEGERALGLRTLGLSGLLGGVVGAVALMLPQVGGPLLAAAFLAHAILIAFFRYREMLAERTYGATTVVAALLVFALGAFAVVVDKQVAAAAGVTVAGLLALKSVLHAWVKRIVWSELRAALVLAAMSVILLPVLPNRAMGPLAALNPYELWLIVVLIAAVSSIGYVAIRVAGERWGILLSGLAGGLVSSTAVTLSFARLARANRSQEPLLAAGILVANITMLARVLALVALFKPSLLAVLAPPLVVAGLVLGVWCFVLQQARDATAAQSSLVLDSPFELATVLKFGLLLTVIMFASKVLTDWLGAGGAFAVAAASGIGDVDAVTLSMSRLAGQSLTPVAAAGAILIAVTVNTIAKLAFATSAGGRSLMRRLTLPLGVATLAGGCALLAVAVFA